MNDQIPPGLLRTPEGIYVLAVDSHLSAWVAEHKRLDIAAHEIDIFAHLIPAGCTMIDAGANLGDHTITYSQLVGPQGRVIACEPHPLTYQALELNMRGRNNVMPLNVALGDCEGEASFQPAPNAGASCIGGDGSVVVKLATIDSMKLEWLDFVHLDCEGSEPAVLRGARETLLRYKPAMVLEVNKGALARYGSSAEQLYGLLAELGYSWREIGIGRPEMEQRDILCEVKA
jgi:FkbM family methyltransferase